MIKKLLALLRRNSPTVPPVLPRQNPYIKFEVNAVGNIGVGAYWPTPASDKEADYIVECLTGMIMLINDGRLLPLIQNSISVYGHYYKDESTAQNVLGLIHEIMKEKYKAEGRVPLVDPEEAFSAREDLRSNE